MASDCLYGVVVQQKLEDGMAQWFSQAQLHTKGIHKQDLIDSGKTPNSSPHLEVLIMMDRGIARIFQRQVILCQIEGNNQIVMSTYMLCFT